MACRTAGLLAALALAGCRVHFVRVAVGGAWTVERALRVEPGVDDREAVLAALGPPDEVRYTLDAEIFLYRTAGHRGVDLRFLVPDPLINVARPALEELAPPLELPDEVGGTALPIRVARAAVEGLLGALNPASTEEAVALHGRRLRWDVARIVLDRATGRARSVEIWTGIAPGSDGAAPRAAPSREA